MLKKILFNNSIHEDAIISNVVLSYDIDYSNPFDPISIDGLTVVVDHTITNGQIFGKLNYTIANEGFMKEFIIPVEQDVSVIRAKPAPKFKPYIYLTSSREPAIRISDIKDRFSNRQLDKIYFYFIDTGLVIAKGVVENTDRFSIVLKTKPTSGKLFIYGEIDGELTSVAERHIQLKPTIDNICISANGGSYLSDDRANIIDVISGAGDVVSNTAMFVGSSAGISIDGQSRPTRTYIPSSVLRNEREFNFTILLKKPSDISRRFNKKVDVYNIYRNHVLDNPSVNEISSTLPKTLLGKVAVTKEGYFILSNDNVLSIYKLENGSINVVKENVMLLESDDDIDSVSVGINEVVVYPYKDKPGLYYFAIDDLGINPLLYNPRRNVNDSFVSGVKLATISNNEMVDYLLNTKYLDTYSYRELGLEDGSYLIRYTVNNHLVFKDNGKFILDDTEYSHPFSGEILEIKSIPIKTGVYIAIRAKNDKMHIIRIDVNSKVASTIYAVDVTGNTFIITDIYNNTLTVIKD